MRVEATYDSRIELNEGQARIVALVDELLEVGESTLRSITAAGKLEHLVELDLAQPAPVTRSDDDHAGEGLSMGRPPGRFTGMAAASARAGARGRSRAPRAAPDSYSVGLTFESWCRFSQVVDFTALLGRALDSNIQKRLRAQPVLGLFPVHGRFTASHSRPDFTLR